MGGCDQENDKQLKVIITSMFIYISVTVWEKMCSLTGARTRDPSLTGQELYQITELSMQLL